MRASGGFQFGADPLNNPSTDPSILGGLTSSTLSPILLTLTKTYFGPEDETATGPNYPREYEISVDIANGQRLDNFQIIDYLPNNLQYLTYLGGTPAGGTAIDEPLAGSAQNPPDNNLVVQWASVTGTAGSADATIRFRYFVPLNDANGIPVIPASTGDDVPSIDDAQARGDWDPIDPLDPLTTAISNVTANDHTLTDKSIAIQKLGAIVDDVAANGLTPGDTLEYTLQFQISDFFAFGGVIISDTIADGQLWQSTITPTLQIEGNGYALPPQAMEAANYTVDTTEIGNDPNPATDGSTTFTFRVSNELVTRGQSGQMVGGCIPTTGTGGPTPDCTTYNNGATTGTLRFRTVVQELFTDTYPSGDSSVDQGDILVNTVSISGDLLNVGDLNLNGNSEADGSGASLEIARGGLAKSIYAINGSTTFPTPVQIAPGDRVTYRLVFSMPTADIENFYLLDYLPLPVFAATEVTTFNPVVSAAAPPAGQAKFGPSDSFFAYSGRVPTVTTTSAENSIRFEYGYFDGLSNTTRIADILFTVTVRNDPFADRLFLTNQARSHEGSTNSGESFADSIVQIQLTEPVLDITKGVVWTDRLGAVFTPSQVGPGGVIFNGSGACPRFTGAVNSTGLAANPINSNLSGLDAGDSVMFAITVENTGSGLNGAFDINIRDGLPPGLTQVPGSLCVSDGTGALIPFTGDLFTSTGITLTDPGPTPLPAGALDPYDPANGRNIALITFNAMLDSSVIAGSTLTNLSVLANYAGEEGGRDHTATDLTDNATVTTLDPLALKTLNTTDQAFTAGNNLAVDERVSFTVTVTVPEGLMQGVILQDTLSAGLAFVQCDQITASAALTAANGFTCANAAFSAFPVGSTANQDQGRLMTLSFGDLTNSNNNNIVPEIVTIAYTAIVVNSAAAVRGANLNNQVQILWNTDQVQTSGPTLTVVEPTLDVVKTAIPTSGDAGDIITFRLTLNHTPASNTNAYNVVISDTVPTGMTYVAGSLANFAGLAATALDDTATPVLNATWTDFPLGSTSTIQFQAAFNNTVYPGQTINNVARTRWTSLPGIVSTPQSPNNPVSCERSGYPADCGGASNTYNDPGNAIVTVTNQPFKSIRSTSEAHTGVVANVERVAIGEIIRYRLRTLWPEGDAVNIRITDRIPIRLQYLGNPAIVFLCDSGPNCMTSTAFSGAGLVINGTQTISNTVTPVFAIPPAAITGGPFGNGTDPTFNLGNISNYDRDASQEFIIIEFNALVLNVTQNQSNSLRQNDFQIYAGSNPAPLVTSNLVNMRVAEPNLVINKTIPTAPVDAGDPVVYRLAITNNSSGANAAAAFDLEVRDILNPALALQSLTASVPFTNTSTAPITVTAILSRLNPGASAVITVTARVVDTAQAGQNIPNTATVRYSSLPGPRGTLTNPTGQSTPGTSGAGTGERNGQDGTGLLNDYIATSSIPTSLGGPAMDKLAPVPATYPIGANLTYNILVTLPEGVTQNLVLVDDLPVGLEYVNAVIVTLSAGSGGLLPADFNGSLPPPTVTTPGGSGGDLTLTFGNTTTTADNLTNNNAFLVQVTARVLNLAGNQNGITLNNTGSLRFTDPETGLVTLNDGPVPVTLVEPELNIDKAVSDPTPAFGQTLTYTLTVSHLPTSTWEALDVVITDTVPTGLTYVPGSATTPVGWTANEASAPQLIFTTPSFPLGNSAAFTYQVIVSSPPVLNLRDTRTNTPLMTWTSLAGSDPSERTGAGGVNDYNDTASSTITVSGPDLQILKTDGNLSATAGGTIVYTLSYQNTGNSTANGVVITDTVPAYTTFNPGSSTAGWACAPDNNAGSLCSIGIGSVNAGASGSVTFAVTVSISLPAGFNQVTNTARISDDGANGSDPTPGNNISTDTTPINAAPDLQIAKDDGGVSTATGNTVLYTLNYANIGTQDATGVQITDTVPVYTTLNSGASTAGWACTPDNSAGSQCAINIGSLIVGGSGSVIFAVTVDATVPAGITQVLNTTRIRDDGMNGSDLSPANNISSDTTPLNAAPDLRISKSDGGVTAFSGGPISYSLVYTNTGTQDATGVVITDIVPLYATFNSGASTAGWACLPDNTAGSLCTINRGSLLAGGSGSVVFALTIDSALPAGITEVTNTAQISDDGSNGSDPTPENNISSDTTPVIAVPNLQITKDDGGMTTIPGGTVVYTVTYGNIGSQDATGVFITETVPANTSFDPAASDSGWTCFPDNAAGSMCTIPIGALVAGGSGSLAFAVTVDIPLPAGLDQVVNTALIGDDGTNGIDPDTSNNRSTDTTPVQAAPDLQITKDDGIVLVAPGSTIQYTLVITNTGDQAATGVLITDTLPLGMDFISASDGGFYTIATRLTTWLFPTLDSGESRTLTLTVQVENPLPGGINSLENLTRISDDDANGSDPTPVNNSDSDIDFSAAASKTLVGTNQTVTSNPQVAVGELLTYEVTLQIAPGTVQNLVLTDILDRGLAFVDCEVVASSSLTTSPIAVDQLCTQSWLIQTEPAGSTNPADQGRRMALNFGDVTNSNQITELLQVRYRVAVLDSGENVRGVALKNQALWTWDGSSVNLTTPTVQIVEPELSVSKQASVSEALPGNIVTYILTIAFTANSNQDAYDITLTDLLPPTLVYVPGSFRYISGQAPTTISATTAPNLTATWAVFVNNGQNSVLEFQAVIGPANQPGAEIVNGATVTWSSLPTLINSPQSPYNPLSTERDYRPGSNVDIYNTQAQAVISVPVVELPSTGFAPGRVTTLLPQTNRMAYTALGNLWLELPRLGVKRAITGVPLVDGTWDVSWLNGDVGWLEGTSFPGQPGNSALTAHNYDANGQPGSFADLSKLKWGDQIILHVYGVTLRYEVRQVLRTSPDNPRPLKHEEKSWLTLITCQGYDPVQDAYQQRVSVRAVLMEVMK